MELIDKAAVVAEIEARYNECLKRAKIIDADYWNGKADTYRDILVVLDTLEVKEVDLEKEFEKYIEQDKAWIMDDFTIEYNNGGSYNHTYDIFPIARHFFELGLKAKE